MKIRKKDGSSKIHQTCVKKDASNQGFHLQKQKSENDQF